MSLTSSPGRTPGQDAAASGPGVLPPGSPRRLRRGLRPPADSSCSARWSGSGYRTPPALVRRRDGQTIQLTPLLYLVLEAIDGERSLAEIAAVVSAAYGRQVGGGRRPPPHRDQAAPARPAPRARRHRARAPEAQPAAGAALAMGRLRPGGHPPADRPVRGAVRPRGRRPRARGVRGHLDVGALHQGAGARPPTRPSTSHCCCWSSSPSPSSPRASTSSATPRPAATAVPPRARWARASTSCGPRSTPTSPTATASAAAAGCASTSAGSTSTRSWPWRSFGVWWAVTRWDALLLILATQLLQMVRQLAPMVRFDGYHVLADLTGVPDLYSRIGPTLRSLLPGHRDDPRATALKPWARAVVTAWVLVIVPLLLFTLVLMVLALPRVLATAWAQPRKPGARCSPSTGPVATSPGWPSGCWRSSRSRCRCSGPCSPSSGWSGAPPPPCGGRPRAGPVDERWLSWWPVPWSRAWPGPGGPTPTGTGRSRPSSVARSSTGSRPSGVVGPQLRDGQVVNAPRTVWASTSTPPTRRHPELALVLVPKGAARGGTTAARPAWVFPFNRPGPPGEGDNQALAVNTTDGSSMYDVAFAMVWADGSSVTNRNEAYAFASCASCTTVAVAFQVVLIVGQADVAIPQNLSGAVNYSCARCVTYALAQQLVLTVPGDLDADQHRRLDALWQQISAFCRIRPARAAGPGPQPAARLPGPGQGAGQGSGHTGTRRQQHRAPHRPGDGDGDPRCAPALTVAHGEPDPAPHAHRHRARVVGCSDDGHSRPDVGGFHRAEQLRVRDGVLRARAEPLRVRDGLLDARGEQRPQRHTLTGTRARPVGLGCHAAGSGAGAGRGKRFRPDVTRWG